MAEPDTPYITIAPADRLVRVTFAGEVIALSSAALVLHEGKYLPVFYLPRGDVRMDLLSPTDHSTYCPHKGDASYWTIETGGKKAVNAVWSYQEPFAQVAAIRNHMAFYPERVDRISAD